MKRIMGFLLTLALVLALMPGMSMADKPKYDVVFVPGTGGTGSMDPKYVSIGDHFKFPECGFTASQGYAFDHWKMSGVDSGSSNMNSNNVPVNGVFYPGDTVLIASNCILEGKITVTACWKGASVYTVTKGGNAEYTIGSGTDLEYTVKEDGTDKAYENFAGVSVGGKAAVKKDFEKKEGSLILTLKSTYLDTLEAGEHKVRITFTDGAVETMLKVKAAATPTPTPTLAPTPAPTPIPVPKTGDSGNPALWIGLVVLGIGVLAVVLGMAARKNRK